MNIINVENITKVYTERELFSKASFYVQEREKIGIVGINGTGKSTLLKIAAGIEEPDEGTVIRANHVVINFLPQNPEFEGDKSVLDNVMDKIITTDMDEAHRWSLESEAKSLMLKLGIFDFDRLPYLDSATIRSQKASHHLHERRLSTTILAYETDSVAFQ